MSKISLNEALKLQQNSAVRAITDSKSNKIVDSYMKVADDSCNTLYDKGVCATLLNNFGKIMDSDLGQSLTHSGDYGPYVMEVWPLVTAWYPDFPLKDLISVQSMDKPLAYLFFSTLKTGTNKGDTAVGDVVETPLGKRQIKGKYPTGEVFGEVIAKEQFSSDESLLAYAPINVAANAGYDKKIAVSIDEGATYTDPDKTTISNGIITLNSTEGTKVAEIEIATGIIKMASTPNKNVIVNYVWDIDFANLENIQKVKETIEMQIMEATPRALMLEWTLFSEYLKKSQFGKDIREDNTKRILNLIYQFQVRYILDELWAYGKGYVNPSDTNSNNITITNTGIYNLDVVNQRAQQSFKNIASSIELVSGRMEGNRIVCGLNFKNWLESLPNTMFKAVEAPSSFLGPREIGTWGSFKVYYDYEMPADKYMMTYRGTEFYDAVYYLGEYMPVVPTDAIALGVTVRESFVSMESYFFQKKNCVYKGTITFA